MANHEPVKQPYHSEPTLEAALQDAIGNRRDDAGEALLPPLISIIASYLKPYIWSQHRVAHSVPSRLLSFIQLPPTHTGDDTSTHSTKWLMFVNQIGGIGYLRKWDVVSGRIEPIECPISPYVICVDPLRPRSYYLLAERSIELFNEETQSLVPVVDHGMESFATSMLCTSDRQSLWVADFDRGYMRVDLDAGTITGTDGFGVCKRLLTWNRGPRALNKPDNEILAGIVVRSVVNDQPVYAHQLSRYDIDANAMSILVNADMQEFAVAETGHIFVSGKAGAVQVFDQTTCELTPLPGCRLANPDMWRMMLVVISEKRWLIGFDVRETWRIELPPEYCPLPPCCERDL